jgi:hypothetical protein
MVIFLLITLSYMMRIEAELRKSLAPRSIML